MSETRDEQKRRFEVECEFVQALANPHYLNCWLLLIIFASYISKAQDFLEILDLSLQFWLSVVSSRTNRSSTISNICSTGRDRTTRGYSITSHLKWTFFFIELWSIPSVCIFSRLFNRLISGITPASRVTFQIEKEMIISERLSSSATTQRSSRINSCFSGSTIWGRGRGSLWVFRCCPCVTYPPIPGESRIGRRSEQGRREGEGSSRKSDWGTMSVLRIFCIMIIIFIYCIYYSQSSESLKPSKCEACLISEREFTSKLFIIRKVSLKDKVFTWCPILAENRAVIYWVDGWYLWRDERISSAQGENGKSKNFLSCDLSGPFSIAGPRPISTWEESFNKVYWESQGSRGPGMLVRSLSIVVWLQSAIIVWCSSRRVRVNDGLNGFLVASFQKCTGTVYDWVRQSFLGCRKKEK